MTEISTAAELPDGEVTLLFTDVEGSTRLWELHSERMLALLVAHDRIVARAIAEAGGVLQRSRAEGDSSFAVFADPRSAVLASISLQRGMGAHPWPDDLLIRTRAALHTGSVEVRGGTYYGPVVNRCVKLRALAHGSQTILSRATVDAVTAAGGLSDDVTVVDLGTHRLKELAVPERVFELRHRDLVSGFPPLRSPDVEQHNLPDRRRGFVGRSEERLAVSEELESERLVTLVGTGGVGKTRLALEVAWARVGEAGDPDRQPQDGTWFADLTGARTGDDVDGILASAIGAREQPGRPILETITDQLGDRAALVVLDNCEHVVPAARRLVQTLLDGCPNVGVLVTSREALGLAGERQRDVPGLPLAEAVDLFADRSGLDLSSPQTASSVERLCLRLDGIPLAIEIAAARAASIGSEAVDRGVAQSQIEEAGRSVLEATLAWSHDLLAPSEQILFRRLGIFAGAFTLEGAEAVVPDEILDAFEILDLVSGLIERSLVQRVEFGAYRQLVVVREYAARLAGEADELDTLAARHLSWCLALALASCEPGLDERECFDPLRQVSDDLLAALDRSFTDDLAAIQVQLAGALEEFFYLRGAYTEGRAHLEAVLERGAGFRSHRAAVYRSAGSLAKWQGDLVAAEGLLGRSRDLWEETLGELRAADSPHVPNFEEHLAVTLIHLSEVARLRGNAGAAAGFARDALALSEPSAAHALLQLALAEHALGDTSGAERHLGEAMAGAEKAGAENVMADCLHELGVIARASGDLGLAGDCYRRALAIDRVSGSEQRLVRSLLSLADLLGLLGADPTEMLEEGLAVARSLGDRRAEANGLSTLADQTAQSDPAEAATLHRTALELLSSVGAPAQEALSRLRVAAFAELAGRLDEAAAETTEVVETFRSLGDDRGAIEALAQLARIETRRGNEVAGTTALLEAVERADRNPTPLEWPDVLDAAAWLAAVQGRPVDARALADEAKQQRGRLGISSGVPAARAVEALRDQLAQAPELSTEGVENLLNAVLYREM